MGHTWYAEIWHTDKTNCIRFGDGDDLTLTAGIGLAEVPQDFLERNTPAKVALTINNNWLVPAKNVLDPAFALWSNGAASAVKRGMYVRVYYRDDRTGTDYRAFQGRIKSRKDGSKRGQVVLTAYNELMILGESADQFVVFADARDRIGDATFANGPDIPCAFNSSNQITATLPDGEIVSPLMRLVVAEPTAYNDHVGENSSSDGLAVKGQIELLAMACPSREFYGFSLYLKNSNTIEDGTVTPVIHNATWDGSKWVVGSLLRWGASKTIPKNTEYSRYDFILPAVLTPGAVYYFGLDGSSSVGAPQIGFMNGSSVPTEYLKLASYSSSWLYSNFLPGSSNAPWAMTLYCLEEREIDSSSYALTDNHSTTSLVVGQGQTTITPYDLSVYGMFIRASYYHGKVSVPDIMIALAQRAGFTAALIPGVSGFLGLGYYNTSTYSYLVCLKELADLWHNDVDGGRQLTFQADMSGALDDKVLRIGLRYRPWNEGGSPVTFSDDEVIAETTALLKRIGSSCSIKQTFEAKVGTARYIGKALDKNPISVEIDDRLWGDDSLVIATGSPLIDPIMDDTLTSGEQLVAAAESVVREQHQNALEGSIPLNGRYVSQWVLDPASSYFGQCAPFLVTRPGSGLSAYQAVARCLSIQGRQTILDLDNERLPDVSMVKRSMDKSLQAQSFNVGSLPDTVHIFPRYASPLSGYSSYDRIRLRRSDGTYFYTTTYGTKVRTNDDHCAPDGDGYVHAAGFFPGGRPDSVTSYVYTGGAPHVYAIDRIAWGDGSSWIEITLDKPYYVWTHQNVLVDFRAPR